MDRVSILYWAGGEEQRMRGKKHVRCPGEGWEACTKGRAMPGKRRVRSWQKAEMVTKSIKFKFWPRVSHAPFGTRCKQLIYGGL